LDVAVETATYKDGGSDRRYACARVAALQSRAGAEGDFEKDKRFV
jgi:hypothetical protein